MIEDNTFITIFVGSAIILFLLKHLESYGYAKAISEFKIFLLLLLITTILFLAVRKTYLVVQERSYRKRYQTEKLPERKKHCTTKKESSKIVKQYTTKKPSKNTIIAKPKDEILHELSPKRSWRKVSIKVDNEVKFHKFKDLNEDEVKYLQHYGFKIKTYFNPFSNKKEKFVIQKKHESYGHFLITQIIVDYLKNKVDDIKTFETVKPDIVFEIKNKKYAIEVETYKVIKYAKKQLQIKVDLLNKDYDDWFFVVLNKNFVSKYRRYGKVLDKRYLKNQLDKFLKKHPK